MPSVYTLKFKNASGRFGGGVVGSIYYNGKYLATIGADTKEKCETIFKNFVGQRTFYQ